MTADAVVDLLHFIDVEPNFADNSAEDIHDVVEVV